jgi:serine/threonine-protein kinase RsbW
MKQTRILALTPREDFVGRDGELRAITQQASAAQPRDTIVMSAPGAGASELLRQAYDQLFLQRAFSIPLLFRLKPDEAATETARRFFKSALQQFIAYRRVDPLLCRAPVTLHDLAELALPADFELVTNLIETYEGLSLSDADFVDFCFGLPHRLSVDGRTIYSLIDCLAVAPFGNDVSAAQHLLRTVTHATGPFVIAGLRRHINDLIREINETHREATEVIHIDRLTDEDASRLIDLLARRHQIETNQPARDLLIQQLDGSPFLLTEFMGAAREAGTQLNTFLNCQRLYVDEVMGGRFKQHFDRIIANVTENPQTTRTLLRVLHESAIGEARKSSLWGWKKRLGVASHEFERIIEALHVYELVNSTAAFIEVNTASLAWTDYLRAQYHLEVAGEPRARVVAATLAGTLKRAPQTMARHYRREAALGLAEVMAQFNCQSAPAVLFDYARFAGAYKGEHIETIEARLDTEADLMRLPQVIYSASCSAFSNTINCDAERCVVAYGFEAAEYTDENETAWLVAQIDAKLEAGRELATEWCDRLQALAAEIGVSRFRIWLIAREGFTDEACAHLKERQAFGSSRQQFDLIADRIRSEPAESRKTNADEYEMIIPMGENSELVAARAVEEIARRLHFRSDAINQIKTALVEACINAAEHSLSPDRKIYQRFRVEDDKLVVTVASRGVVPAQLPGQNGQEGGAESNLKGRRGWGLKLIRTLMDEVEFERVDDGTRLKMTKYIRK